MDENVKAARVKRIKSVFGKNCFNPETHDFNGGEGSEKWSFMVN